MNVHSRPAAGVYVGRYCIEPRDEFHPLAFLGPSADFWLPSLPLPSRLPVRVRLGALGHGVVSLHESHQAQGGSTGGVLHYYYSGVRASAGRGTRMRLPLLGRRDTGRYGGDMGRSSASRAAGPAARADVSLFLSRRGRLDFFFVALGGVRRGGCVGRARRVHGVWAASHGGGERWWRRR